MKFKYLLFLLLIASGLFAQAPTITAFGNLDNPFYLGQKGAFSACQGLPSDQVTILGTNFTSNTTVTSGDFNVPVIFYSSVLIGITFPELTPGISGNYNGIITVETPSGQDNTGSIGNLDVLACPNFPSSILGLNTPIVVTGNDLGSLSNSISLSVGGFSFSSVYNPVSKELTFSLPNQSSLLGINTFIFSQSTAGVLNGEVFSTPEVKFVTPPSPPIITSVMPIYTLAGQPVTIFGYNFDPIVAKNAVFIGGSKANIISATPFIIVANVPFGATNSKVTVVNKTSLLQASYYLSMTPTFAGPGSFTGSMFGLANFDEQSINATNFIKTADFDSDGNQDIITYGSGVYFTILRNTSSGNTINGSSFQNVMQVDLFANINDIELKDINNDGKIDIIATGDGISPGPYIAYMLNVHTGGPLTPASFGAPTSIPYNGVDAPNDVDLIDLDQDGRVDLVSAYGSTNISISGIYIQRNLTGEGSVPGIQFDQTGQYLQGGNASDLGSDATHTFADVNGDLAPDIIRWATTGGIPYIYRNTSTIGGISFDPNSYAPDIGNSIKAADIDNDGNDDLIAVNGNGLQVLLRQSAATATINGNTFATLVTYPIAGLSAGDFDIADVDGDGKLDVAITDANSREMIFMKNLSNVGIVTFDIEVRYDVDPLNNISYAPQGILMIDMDGDEAPDAVISRPNLGSVAVFKQNGFTCPLPIVTLNPVAPPAICAGSGTYVLSADGIGSISQYRWQADGGGGFINIADDAVYSGSATNSLTISGVPLGLNNISLRLQLSGSCGASFTSTITTTVVGPPVIYNEPASPGPVCELAGTVLLTADVSGKGLSYKWQAQSNTDTTWFNISNSQLYQGVFTQTLTVNDPPLTLSGYHYRIRVNGLCANTLTGILLSDGTAGITVYGPNPVILTQPTSPAPVCNSAFNALFTISVGGVDLEYQWEEFTSNWASLDESYYYRGTNMQTLTVTGLDSTANGRKYRVRVTGVCSQSFTYSDSTAKLTTYKRPVILPTVANDCNPGSSRLTVMADTNFRSYQWRIDSATINNSDTAIYSLLINGFYSVYVNNNPKCNSKGFNYISASSAIKPLVTAFGQHPKDTLLSTIDSGAYQWYVNKRLIQGAKSKSLEVHFNGMYYVIVKYPNGCEGVSDNYQVNESSYTDVLKSGAEYTDSTISFQTKIQSSGNITLVPNPSSGSFNVHYTSLSTSGIKAKLYDLNGNLILEQALQSPGNSGIHQAFINSSSLISGIYQLQIIDGQSVKWSKVVIY